MTDNRPDPDKILALIGGRDDAQGNFSGSQRGRLKIFFGAFAGVGKTFAMLSEARRLMIDGRDVMIGVVEHHNRPETLNLTEGLPRLALKLIEHRGVSLYEFDLDAALKRRPGLILMDEYAHTNGPGSRHLKRWQDVEELLASGIDVYTTLNVQHLESLNDMVARLTGIWVSETVPDAVFDRADELALIDLPPDELIERLKAGKVYVAEGAGARAQDNFFKKNNLGALREMALRRMAERVDAQNDALAAASGRHETGISDHFLVLVGPEPLSARLIRHTKRMADRAKAPWTAVYVQTDRHMDLSDQDKIRLERHLRLAERLGGQITRLHAAHVVPSISDFAHRNGFTRIVVGYRKLPLWQRWAQKSLSQKLIDFADGLVVIVISDEDANSDPREKQPPKPSLSLQKFEWSYLPYGAVLGLVGLATLIGLPLRGHLEASLFTLFYLTGVVVIAAYFGIGPSIFGSVISVLAFNFFFTKPYNSFTFDDPSYGYSFVFMLITSLIVGSLTARLSRQARITRLSEQDIRRLYGLSRALSTLRGSDAMAKACVTHFAKPYNLDLRLYLQDSSGLHLYPENNALPVTDREQGVVDWVFTQAQAAGKDTDTLPSALGLYLPLMAEGKAIGVIGLLPKDPSRSFTGSEILQFETMASLVSGAIQASLNSDEALSARIESANERLRNVLLASLSHDLRTPLTIMSQGLSSLLRRRKKLPREALDELTTLWNQSERLQKFVDNLLNMAAISSGRLSLNRQPYLIQELIGAALQQIEPLKHMRQITTSISGLLPMVEIDGSLIEQVFVNLLENAIAHTSERGKILISVEQDADRIRVRVTDNGPGLAEGQEDIIFETFQAAKDQLSDRNREKGTGLGLAICKGIIEAHGGLIYAKTVRLADGTRGGASFIFTLPIFQVGPNQAPEARAPAQNRKDLGS